MKIFMVLATVSVPVFAQMTESLEFSGPDSAPIYVLEGDFTSSYSLNGIDYVLDWSCTMNPASGALTGAGNFSLDGSFYWYGWRSINFAGSMGVALTGKQAGSVLRVNGKMALSGWGNIAGYEVNPLTISYVYSNVDVDPVAGQMSGYISAKGKAIVPGYGSFPVNVPRTYLSQELPDADTDGQWDSTGDWTAEIDATVTSKGKISGTGELAVLDEDGEIYDLIPQNVSGSLKNGTVSLNAAGNNRSTSKIKVNLTYLQANDQTVSGKNAVSAYGQNRKF
jgi:hypothetical protein